MRSHCARPFVVRAKLCIPTPPRSPQRRRRGNSGFCERPMSSCRIHSSVLRMTRLWCRASHHLHHHLSSPRNRCTPRPMVGGVSVNAGLFRVVNGGLCCYWFWRWRFACSWGLVVPGPGVSNCRFNRVGWWPSRLLNSLCSWIAAMSTLPPGQTPLNQHSLRALETWLTELGAVRSVEDPCLWVWQQPEWSSRIRLDQDDLLVIWSQNGLVSQRTFPYGLSRLDVEAAMRAGP